MFQDATPSGTAANATTDDIVADELHKLEEYRSQMTNSNRQYIESHPEIRNLLDNFVGAIMTQKPNDLVKFGFSYFNNLRKNDQLGPCPTVISGPSGVGKGTLIDRLLKKFPSLFGFSVSHTTRLPRQGEIDGVHYHFVSKEEFEEAVERGDFIEYAKVHTNYYGTSFHAVEKIRSQGKICILDIDVQGVQNVRNSKLDFKSVFITPPSILELERRLQGRGTETADKIKIRLENAAAEIAYSQVEGNFDLVLTNDDIEVSFLRLVSILQNWFPELDLYTGK